MGGTLRYWGTALAVMLGFGWAMAADFGWVGSEARARAGGTYGAMHFTVARRPPFGNGREVTWSAASRSRGGKSLPARVSPGRGAGIALAEVPWEKADARYLAGLSYGSAPLQQGTLKDVRIGTVIALRTSTGDYAKLRIVRMRRNDGVWEWVVYPPPAAAR